MSQPFIRIALVSVLFFVHPGLSENRKADEASCRALYLKQIEELSRTRDLSAVGIAERKAELLEESTVSKAAHECMAGYSADRVACELKGDCKSSDPDRQPEKDPAEDPARDPDQNPDKIAPSPIATQAQCAQAYDHLLSVYTTEEFTKKPGSDRLIQNWKSDVSRRSFEMRCTKVFHKSDIECITGSRDPDYVRACLLLIPE